MDSTIDGAEVPMATPSWRVNGQYYETCSCDFVCPCILGQMAASRFALAHASKSHVNALGLSWKDVTGTNNGQYAPFSWQQSA